MSAECPVDGVGSECADLDETVVTDKTCITAEVSVHDLGQTRVQITQGRQHLRAPLTPCLQIKFNQS